MTAGEDHARWDAKPSTKRWRQYSQMVWTEAGFGAREEKNGLYAYSAWLARELKRRRRRGVSGLPRRKCAIPRME